MSRSVLAKVAFAVVLMTILLTSAAGPAAADPPFVIDLPQGQACPNFDLRVAGSGTDRVVKEFTDKDGNVIRRISAGKGQDLVFTNLATNATLTLKANGSVNHETINPDGSSTVAATGHNVIILFPTDVPLPPATVPSTVLYVGRIVYTVDADQVFRVQQVSARTTDICATLSH